MFKARCAAFVLAAASVLACLEARADVVAVDRADQGWYAQTGAHFAGNQNTFTGLDTSTLFGTAPLGAYHFNSFFVFDLPTLGGPATAAAVNFYVSDVFNDDPVYQFTIFDVSGSAAALSAGHASGDGAGQAIYSDLGSGVSYASFDVQRFYQGQQFHVLLNAGALAEITAHSGGAFAIGVSFTGTYETTGGPEGVNFGFDGDPQARLVVGTGGSDISDQLADPRSVPLPTGAALGAAGLGMLAMRRRRRA